MTDFKYFQIQGYSQSAPLGFKLAAHSHSTEQCVFMDWGHGNWKWFQHNQSLVDRFVWQMDPWKPRWGTPAVSTVIQFGILKFKVRNSSNCNLKNQKKRHVYSMLCFPTSQMHAWHLPLLSESEWGWIVARISARPRASRIPSCAFHSFPVT